MKEVSRELFTAMHQFKRLRIGDLFPEINKGDSLTLAAVEHVSRQKDGKLTVTDLAEHTHCKMSAVSRSLKTLEDKGYIERTVNKTDRRNTYVTLTESGQAIVKKIEGRINDFTEAVFSRMEEADMKKLLECLNELYEIAEEEIEIRSENIRKEENLDGKNI